MTAVGDHETTVGRRHRTHGWDLENGTSLPGVIRLPDLASQFHCFPEQKPFGEQLLDVVKEVMYLWSLSLCTVIVTIPLLLLIVGSFTIIDGVVCTPSDTLASIAYMMLGGLAAGGGMNLILIWSFGMKKMFIISFGIFAFLHVATNAIVIILNMVQYRLLLTQAEIILYWLLCGCYHFMQLQEASVRQAMLYFVPLCLCLGITVITLHYVLQFINSRVVLLYIYRIMLHPIFYFLCIRLSGFLMLYGWTRAKKSFAIMSSPFIFTLVKSYVGRYVQSQLPFLQFVGLNVGLAFLEVLNYVTYPPRRKYVLRVMSYVLTLGKKYVLRTNTTPVPANKVRVSAQNASVSCHSLNSSPARTPEPNTNPKSIPKPDLNSECSPVIPCSSNVPNDNRLPRAGSSVEPTAWAFVPDPCVQQTDSLAEVSVNTTAPNTIEVEAALLADILHVTTLIADTVLEPIVVSQLSACKLLFFWFNSVQDPDYRKVGVETAIVLGIQLLMAIYLHWWTRFRHNLSVPEIITCIGGRRFCIGLICLNCPCAMTFLRSMTLASQGFDYKLPPCTGNI